MMSDSKNLRDSEYNDMNPSGYKFGRKPIAYHPFWSKISSIVNTVFHATVDDKSGTPSVDVADSGNEVTFNFHGLKGEKGETGPIGPMPDKYVKSVGVVNENGVYAVNVENGDGTSSSDSIEVPNTDNLIAEVNDSIVENNSDGYDYHTITETENNGTQNNVGSFYIGQKQFIGVDNQMDYGFGLKYVDQNGKETEQYFLNPEKYHYEIRLELERDDGGDLSRGNVEFEMRRQSSGVWYPTGLNWIGNVDRNIFENLYQTKYNFKNFQRIRINDTWYDVLTTSFYQFAVSPYGLCIIMYCDYDLSQLTWSSISLSISGSQQHPIISWTVNDLQATGAKPQFLYNSDVNSSLWDD